MKNILFIILLSCSLCKGDIETLYLSKNETLIFDSSHSEGKFYVKLDEFTDRNFIEFRFEAYGGSVSDTIKYKCTNTYEESSLTETAIKYEENERKENGINIKVLEFSLKIEKINKYLVAKYDNFHGNKLTIKVIKSERAEYLRNLANYIGIGILICCCICCITGGCIGCYCCCCKKNKENYPGEIMPINEGNNVPPSTL